MHEPELIAFDLDGTLVDSVPDLAYAVDSMLGRLGLAPLGLERVRPYIGLGMHMLVKRALTGEMWPQGEPARFEEALALFVEIYSANLCERGGLFPGVLEGLQAVKARGCKAAVVTNKPSFFTLPLLEKLGVVPYLDFVGCGDQFGKHKPDPEPLLKTAERFGISPDKCLMVGDSANDVQAARAAGFAVLVVPYGYRCGLSVEELGADGVIASLDQLPCVLAQAA